MCDKDVQQCQRYAYNNRQDVVILLKIEKKKHLKIPLQVSIKHSL